MAGTTTTGDTRWKSVWEEAEKGTKEFLDKAERTLRGVTRGITDYASEQVKKNREK